jgi:hypothetical protein
LNVYALAENLHMPVYRLTDEMPVAEFLGWIEFNSQRRGDNKPALNPDDPSSILKAFKV